MVLRRDPPTVTLTGGGSGTTNTVRYPVTAQFSEAVTGFDDTDVSVGNGTVSNFLAVDADTYTFDVSATATGPVTVDIGAGVALDLATNPNTASNTLSWIYDGTPPTVTIDQAVGQVDPTNNPVVHFTVQFDEPVTGFGAGDVDLSGSTAHGRR